MINHYPTLNPDEIARNGEPWVFCDVGSCDNAAKIDGVSSYVVRDETRYEAVMPDGWGTSDPDDNALAGAAQFCPAHISRLSSPVADPPAPVEG